MYQDLNLKRSDHKKQYVLKPYNEIITLLAFSVEQRFVELVGSPSFKSFICQHLAEKSRAALYVLLH